jgi:hypothetical protein
MNTRRAGVFTLALLVLALAAVPAFGEETSRGLGRSNDDWIGGYETGVPISNNLIFAASATGFSVVPAVMTPGRAWFRARVLPSGSGLEYELTWELEGPIKDAFLFIGQPGVNGGKALALCVEELPPVGVPNGAPLCPAGENGLVYGMLMPEDILPSAALQGVNGMEELIAAMIARITYVNVYSHVFPQSGEVRGEVAPLRLGNGGGPGGIGSSDIQP